MADAIFEHPRLAAIYDAFDGNRSDLDFYESLIAEFGARSVLDIGCGTGTLACRLALRGLDVVGLDPAEASLQIAQSKPGGERVRWIKGTVGDLPRTPSVDMVTMTANVAQVFLSDGEWVEVLSAAKTIIKPGGHLVFETRKPETRDWQSWNREDTYTRLDILGLGTVEGWVDVTKVDEPFITFRHTYVFKSDDAIFTSDSTLRFRSREEIVRSLNEVGFAVHDIREAPDRPGKEMVFIAQSATQSANG